MVRCPSPRRWGASSRHHRPIWVDVVDPAVGRHQHGRQRIGHGERHPGANLHELRQQPVGRVRRHLHGNEPARAGLSSDFSTRPWAVFEVRNSTQLPRPHRRQHLQQQHHQPQSGGWWRRPTASASTGTRATSCTRSTVSWWPPTTHPPAAACGPSWATARQAEVGWRSTGCASRRTPRTPRTRPGCSTPVRRRPGTRRPGSRATPAGTSITIRVRSGNTASPDGTWTAYTSVPTSGATIAKPGRYLQYEAVLTSSSNRQTPQLQQIAFGFGYRVRSNVQRVVTRPTVQSGGVRRARSTWSPRRSA